MSGAPIDFVIPWVDGNDPDWQKRKAKVTGTEYSDDRPQRYREWDLLRYWFRGVEKFAPWVRKVWFICDQQPPKWLNQAHPQLEVVRHEDYLPEQYRPAFSANPIELNIHRIKGLAEQFVYFNDDMYLIRPVKETFYFKKGFPRDHALLSPILATELARAGRDAHISPIYLNDIEYLNCDYDFRTCFRANIWKWLNPCYGKNVLRNIFLLPWPRFVGLVEDHLPNAYLKSSFEKAWIRDFDILDATSRHPIRDDRDVNQWMIRHQQLAEGRFIPQKPQMQCYFEISKDEERMHSTIRKQEKTVICLNDSISIDEETFKEVKHKVKADFDCIIGEKSSFELF